MFVSLPACTSIEKDRKRASQLFTCSCVCNSFLFDLNAYLVLRWYRNAAADNMLDGTGLIGCKLNPPVPSLLQKKPTTVKKYCYIKQDPCKENEVKAM